MRSLRTFSRRSTRKEESANSSANESTPTISSHDSHVATVADESTPLISSHNSHVTTVDESEATHSFSQYCCGLTEVLFRTLDDFGIFPPAFLYVVTIIAILKVQSNLNSFTKNIDDMTGSDMKTFSDISDVFLIFVIVIDTLIFCHGIMIVSDDLQRCLAYCNAVWNSCFNISKIYTHDKESMMGCVPGVLLSQALTMIIHEQKKNQDRPDVYGFKIFEDGACIYESEALSNDSDMDMKQRVAVRLEPKTQAYWRQLDLVFFDSNEKNAEKSRAVGSTKIVVERRCFELNSSPEWHCVFDEFASPLKTIGSLLISFEEDQDPDKKATCQCNCLGNRLRLSIQLLFVLIMVIATFLCIQVVSFFVTIAWLICYAIHRLCLSDIPELYTIANEVISWTNHFNLTSLSEANDDEFGNLCSYSEPLAVECATVLVYLVMLGIVQFLMFACIVDAHRIAKLKPDIYRTEVENARFKFSSEFFANQLGFPSRNHSGSDMSRSRNKKIGASCDMDYDASPEHSTELAN